MPCGEGRGNKDSPTCRGGMIPLSVNYCSLSLLLCNLVGRVLGCCAKPWAPSPVSTIMPVIPALGLRRQEGGAEVQ